MSDVKSILIKAETHEEMKEFSIKKGIKIKFIAEEAIKEYINKKDKEDKKNGE